jgi:hypothetical protein
MTSISDEDCDFFSVFYGDFWGPTRDDWYIHISQKHIKDTEPILQKALDNSVRLTLKTGISIVKTKTIVFTKSYPGRLALKLKLQGKKIEEVGLGF